MVILNGMVEQHYRKEVIPKVSILDQKTVLKRRLNLAFPNYPIRAALKSTGSEERKSNSYLFVAMPQSDSFRKVIAAVATSMVSIVGVYLLPVEAAPMVKKLVTKLYDSTQARSVWTIMVGQHHGGGLRQVVTRNGELALTRMSPVVDTDVEPDLWCEEVYNEIKATMGYLSRFGYSANDGLNIIIIANDSCSNILEKTVDINCNLKVLNAKEASSLLSLKFGNQEDLRYADTLYASYLGKQFRFVLPLEAASVTRLIKPRRVASFITLAALVGVLGMGFFISQSLKERMVMDDKSLVSRQQLVALKQEYDIELEKKKKIGFDFLFVNNAIEIFDGYKNNKTIILPLVHDISRSLGAGLQIDDIKMEVVDKGNKQTNPYAYPEADLNENKQSRELKTVITLSFSDKVEPDVGVSLVNTLRDRLQINLPDRKVEVVKQVAGLSYTGNFAGESGDEFDSEAEDLKAEILIMGGIQ